MRTIELTATLLLLTSLAGCEFFEPLDDGSDDDFTVGSDDEGETGPPPPPSEGFRVFPKYMLESIPAIVTIEVDLDPVPCELDDAPEGGYVCDADLLTGTQATIRVDRNGFESAVRHPDISPNQISSFDVHLAVEGGPTGVWSACISGAGIANCEVVCEAEMSTCAVTSCDTTQEEFPIATVKTFDDLECTVELDNLVPACDEAPSPQEPVALKCCCAG